MNKYVNTINKKGKTYEIYHTSNPFIKYLGNRLLNKVEKLLININANQLKGIDIGSGEGHMLHKLKSKNIIDSIIGVDLDEERIQYAREHFPDIEFFIEDIYNMNMTNNQFDYVIATEILEHLPKPDVALNIFDELTKKEGYIITSVPHEPYFQFGNMARGKHWHNRGKTPAHLNFWNKKEFEKFLIKNNVTIIKKYNLSTFPWLLYLGRFNS